MAIFIFYNLILFSNYHRKLVLDYLEHALLDNTMNIMLMLLVLDAKLLILI